jgi:cytochrome bd-type quinol oxidase subunit 1
VPDGRFMPDSWLAILFNPSFPYRFVHTVTAAYLTTAMIVGAVGAWRLLRDPLNANARLMFSMAMWTAALRQAGLLAQPGNAQLHMSDRLDIVMAACAPLEPPDRSAFLVMLASRLRGVDVLGDGLIARTCREVQAQFWRAPDLARAAGTSKYR